MEEPRPTNVRDRGSPTANMFGLEPCPQCGSKFRTPWNREGGVRIECDDCDHQEMDATPEPEW